jgi:hypothetical protein
MKDVCLTDPLRYVERLAVREQMQVGIVCQQHAASGTGSIQQPAPHPVHHSPTGEHRRNRLQRWQVPARVGVAEQSTIAIVAIALGWCAVGNQYDVPIQLDVI